MHIPKVSIIVLNYNGLNFLKACLRTIKKQTYENIETIVIDNHSTDGSIEYVKRLKWLKLMVNPDNYGYAKANNIAAQAASGHFLFFLNMDTELFDDTIEKLIAAYADHSILAPQQIVTSKQGQPAHKFVGNGVDIFGYPFGEDQINQTKVFYADGAALFIKTADFQQIGGFDSELFMFQEDIDLSWRAQLYGYHIKSCPSASLYHYSGGAALGGAAHKGEPYMTTTFRRYLNEKNVIRNLIKNYSLPFLTILLPLLLIIHLTETLILIILGKLKISKCYWQAYWWNLIHLSNTWQLRRQIQSRRQISDWQLIKRMSWNYSKLVAFYRLGLPVFK